MKSWVSSAILSRTRSSSFNIIHKDRSPGIGKHLPHSGSFKLPRLRRMSGRECCKILSQNGFSEVRLKGSHIQMQRKAINEFGFATLTVTVPDHKELRIGTLAKIIARSQLPRSLFET